MRDEVLSSTRAVGVAAMLSIAIAACDSRIAVESASGSQVRSAKWSPVAWSAARPHVLRAELDEAGGTIWALHAGGIDVYDGTSSEKVRAIRLPGWTWASAPDVCPPDFTLTPNRHVLVTSNVLPVIWRIDPASFDVSRHEVDVEDHRDRDVGFAGLAYAALDGSVFAVGAHDGALWRIDPSLTLAQPVIASPALPRACGVAVMRDAGTNQASLCVPTEHGDWIVALAPEHRTGRARPTRCADR